MVKSMVKGYSQLVHSYRQRTARTPGQEAIEYHTCSISPKEAEHILKFQAPNRPKHAATIAFYAQEMKLGKFLLNGETLIFDDKLRLLDGQHRIQAIIDSNVTIVSAVVFGIPEVRFHTIDQGKKRSVSDIVSVSDLNEPGRSGAVAKRLHAWACRYFPQTKLISGYDIIKILKKHPDLTYARKMVSKNASSIQRSDFALLYYLIRLFGDDEEADKYFRYVSRGDNIPSRCPSLIARNFFLQRKSGPVATKFGKIIDAIPFRVMLVGWNLFSTGQKVGHEAFWSEVKKSAEDPEGLFKVWSPSRETYQTPPEKSCLWLFGDEQ